MGIPSNITNVCYHHREGQWASRVHHTREGTKIYGKNIFSFIPQTYNMNNKASLQKSQLSAIHLLGMYDSTCFYLLGNTKKHITIDRHFKMTGPSYQLKLELNKLFGNNKNLCNDNIFSATKT